MRFHNLCYVVPLALLSQVTTAQCCLLGGGQKKLELNTGYNAAIPLGEMGKNVNTTHSAALCGLYLIPATGKRVGIGVEAVAGSYASFTRTQTFGMNGVETPTEVHYNSNVTTVSGVMRYEFLSTQNLSAFADVKAGAANYTSRIEIEDPNDPDGCEPMDTKNLISDYTWIAGVQTGVNIDMRTFIKKMPAQTFLLQPYVGYVHGGNIDYVNVKNASTDDHASHGQTTAPDGGRPVDVRFVNLQTNAQHTHEVARVYTSPVQLLECGLLLVVRF